MPLPLIIPAAALVTGATLGGNSLLGVFRSNEPRSTSANVSSAVKTLALAGVATVAIIAVTKGFKK